jgi:hypothetical protein
VLRISIFVDCLKKTGQQRVASVLEADGKLARVEAKFNDTTDVKEKEAL